MSHQKDRSLGSTGRLSEQEGGVRENRTLRLFGRALETEL